MQHFESILILMVVIWLSGIIFRYLNLPIIFGELLGGILVGPLVLNWVDPNDQTIKILAELGVFFLMLHSGLETNPNELFKATKKSILIALFGVLFPFAGGVGLGYFFGKGLTESLFLGVALSITAIAVSIRLFKDNRIQKTKVFNLVIGAAVIDDIIALVLFSMVLSIAKNGSFEPIGLLFMLLKVIAFFAVVIFVGYKTSGHLPKVLRRKGFTFTLITALTLGLIAEAIGLHAIIGAFLAGLFIRQEIIDEKVFNKIEDRIFGMSYSFLGPIFFASLAFHLDFKSFFNAPIFLLAILIVAIIGKVLGSGIAAYLQKIDLKQSLLIGMAMNSRGAVELIIASIGIQEGIIGPEVFSALILMAFATTIISIVGIGSLAKYAK